MNAVVELILERMRLPDFLVIGAMKAGTTSLCSDLETIPDVFFPTVKEPHTLCLDSVLTPGGRRRYAALFRAACDNQRCGEGSTGYTKVPLHRGVPRRAKSVLGGQLRLVYLVREPVSRAISHHYHMYRSGDAPRSFEDAYRSNPLIAECSRYARQLEPWLDVFGRDNLHVVRFETYIHSRDEVVGGVCRFLEVEPLLQGVSLAPSKNRGDEQVMAPMFLRHCTRSFTCSQWYKRVVHPYAPRWLRERFKAVFYKQAPSRPDPPSIELIDEMIEQLEDDVARLPLLLGEKEPYWDLMRVRQSFVDGYQQVGSCHQI